MKVELVVVSPPGVDGMEIASEAMADAFRGLGIDSADSDAYDGSRWSALSDMLLDERIYDATIIEDTDTDTWVVSLVKGLSAVSVDVS